MRGDRITQRHRAAHSAPLAPNENASEARPYTRHRRPDGPREGNDIEREAGGLAINGKVERRGNGGASIPATNDQGGGAALWIRSAASRERGFIARRDEAGARDPDARPPWSLTQPKAKNKCEGLTLLPNSGKAQGYFKEELEPMLIRPAAPVGEMVNKMGQDYVAFISRGRQMSRQWVNPTNPGTTVQSTVRGIFAQISAAWRTVSDAQDTAWSLLNDQLGRTDSLGREYGFFTNNAFMQVNFYRLLDGQAITLDPPAFNPPAPPTGITSLSALDPAELIFTHANAAGTFFYITISPNTASQRRRARRNDLRMPCATLADGIIPQSASPITVINDFARIGLPATGPAWVGVRIQALSSGYLPGGSLFVPSLAVDFA